MARTGDPSGGRVPNGHSELSGTQPVGSIGVASEPRPNLVPRIAIPAGQQQICPHCGAIGLDQQSRCLHCEEDYDAPLLVPATTERRYWVGIEATLSCHACGHASPCNHLDLENTATCLHCGLEQRLDPNQWWGALAHAHAVGDLCGPHPEGRFPNELASVCRHNPFAEVGLRRTSASHRGHPSDPEQPTLDVVATPGHPLCPSCRAPLALARVQPPELDVACPNPACSTRITSVLPDGVRVKVADLLGILGREHEQGRRDVRIERTPHGLVCRCPACADRVHVVSYSTLATCEHCGTASRVPDKALRLLGFERPKTETWWLLFEGPSRMRSKLERVERKALARVAPKLGFPLRPEQPSGDELMAPLRRGPGAVAKGLVLALIALALVGVAIAIVTGGSPAAH